MMPSRSLSGVIVVCIVIACGLLPAKSGRAASQDVSLTPIPGMVREIRGLDVTLPDGARATLETLITRPVQAERVPLVLVSHGNPPDPATHPKLSPTAFAELSLMFARHGYGVAVVMRQGYGRSTGTFVDTSGPCSNKEYLRSARGPADEILAALARLRNEAWVDPGRVLLLGHSAGGLQSLVAGSTNPAGVLGVLSFAGGRGSDGSNHVCQPDRLIGAMREMGRVARVPGLWIYAQNDHFFAPGLATQMRDAYLSSGARAELVLAAPFDGDGHLLVHASPKIWWPYVVPFLKERGLPTELLHPASPIAIQPPPGLSPAGRAAFAEYTSSEAFEKAFAVGANVWSWTSGRRTKAEAALSATERCEKHGKPCAVYAVGNQYAQ